MNEIAYQYHAAPPQRTIVIGDIHGCYREMLQLLDVVRFTDRDLLISVGDLVDRGPDSRAVLRYFMEHDNAIAVAGNHERKIRRILEDGLEPGSMQTLTLNQLSGEEMEPMHTYLRNMPTVIETPDVLVVHARIDPARTLREQSLKHCAAVGGPSVEIPVDEDGVPLWYWDWQHRSGGLEDCVNGTDTLHEHGSKPVCFGHLQFCRVELVPRCLFALDTGAVSAGCLTAYVVEENRIVSVNVSRDYFFEARTGWKKHLVTHTDVRTGTIKAIEKIREPEVVSRQRRAFEEAGFFSRTVEIAIRIRDCAGPIPPSGPERGEYIRTIRGWFPDAPPRLVNLITRERPLSWEEIRKVLQQESLVSLMEILVFCNIQTA
jgi:serine/threonine protein phosphatase 1